MRICWKVPPYDDVRARAELIRRSDFIRRSKPGRLLVDGSEPIFKDETREWNERDNWPRWEKAGLLKVAFLTEGVDNQKKISYRGAIQYDFFQDEAKAMEWLMDGEES